MPIQPQPKNTIMARRSTYPNLRMPTAASKPIQNHTIPTQIYGKAFCLTPRPTIPKPEAQIHTANRQPIRPNPKSQLSH